MRTPSSCPRHAARFLCFAILAACQTESPGSSPASAESTPGVRTFGMHADTLWLISAGSGEPTLEDPWYLAAGAGGVFVVDYARGLLALTDSGELYQRDEEQPSAPVLGPIVVLDDSTVVIVRSDNGTLYHYDTRGTRRPRQGSADVADIRALCALDARTLLLGGGSDRLAAVDLGGGAARTFAFPWRDLRDSASLLRQTVLASSPDRPGCVVALAVGSGFALVHGPDSLTLHRYVEDFVPPPVQRSVETAGDRITTTVKFLRRATAAASVAVDDTAIYVAFGGATPRRRGLIDIYDRGRGAYRASLEVGAPVLGLAAGNGALYVLYQDSGLPALAALRLRPR